MEDKVGLRDVVVEINSILSKPGKVSLYVGEPLGFEPVPKVASRVGGCLCDRQAFSPPVTLADSRQDLNFIVDKVDDETFEKWAVCKACQVDSLASAVLAGLDQGPYTLRLLTSLANVSTLRDVFLKGDPDILNKLLDHVECKPVKLSIQVDTLPSGGWNEFLTNTW